MAQKTNPSVVTTSFPLPGRSVYDLSHKRSFDADFGIVIPIEHFEVNPFERFDILPVAQVKTITGTLAPIMSRARCRIIAVWSPDKNYVPAYLTNRADQDIALPQIAYYSQDAETGGLQGDDLYWSAVAPHSLLNSFLPTGFNPNRLPEFTVGTFAAHNILTYVDFVRNYIVNRNEALCYRQNSYNYEVNGVGETTYDSVALTELDSYFERRAWIDDINPERPLVDVATYRGASEINQWLQSPDPATRADYSLEIWDYLANGGLFLKPHMPDINSSFASNDRFEEAMAKSVVRLTADQAGQDGISYQSILDSNRIWNYYNKVLATGGQMDEMMRAEYGVNVADDLDIPMFLKQWSFDLGFEDVVASTADAAADQNLGDLAGRGGAGLSYGDPADKNYKRRIKKNTLHFRSKHYGVLAFYFVIEPYAEYFEGISPFMLKKTTLDKFWPSFDRAGWQPLMLSQLSAVHEGSDGPVTGFKRWSENENPFTNQVGVQPAYTEYKAMPSTNFGEVSRDLRYWTFSRSYAGFEADDEGTVGTPFNTYVFPEQYHYAFPTVEGTKSWPFVVTVGFKATAKRPISHVQLSTQTL